MKACGTAMRENPGTGTEYSTPIHVYGVRGSLYDPFFQLSGMPRRSHHIRMRSTLRKFWLAVPASPHIGSST